MSDVYMKNTLGERLQDNEGCKHPVAKARYLTTHVSPHVVHPGFMSVANCIFLCEDCGQLFSAFIEVSRGYLGDGTISPESMEEIRKIQVRRDLEAKAVAAAGKAAADSVN